MCRLCFAWNTFFVPFATFRDLLLNRPCVNACGNPRWINRWPAIKRSFVVLNFSLRHTNLSHSYYRSYVTATTSWWAFCYVPVFIYSVDYIIDFMVSVNQRVGSVWNSGKGYSTGNSPVCLSFLFHHTSSLTDTSKFAATVSVFSWVSLRSLMFSCK